MAGTSKNSGNPNTLKYKRFIADRRAIERDVIVIPGIGDVLGWQLRKRRHSTVQSMVDKFHAMEGDIAAYQRFVKNSCPSSNSREVQHCSLGIQNWCQRYCPFSALQSKEQQEQEQQEKPVPAPQPPSPKSSNKGKKPEKRPRSPSPKKKEEIKGKTPLPKLKKPVISTQEQHKEESVEKPIAQPAEELFQQSNPQSPDREPYREQIVREYSLEFYKEKPPTDHSMEQSSQGSIKHERSLEHLIKHSSEEEAMEVEQDIVPIFTSPPSKEQSILEGDETPQQAVEKMEVDAATVPLQNPTDAEMEHDELRVINPPIQDNGASSKERQDSMEHDELQPACPPIHDQLPDIEKQQNSMEHDELQPTCPPIHDQLPDTEKRQNSMEHDELRPASPPIHDQVADTEQQGESTAGFDLQAEAPSGNEVHTDISPLEPQSVDPQLVLQEKRHQQAVPKEDAIHVEGPDQSLSSVQATQTEQEVIAPTSAHATQTDIGEGREGLIVIDTAETGQQLEDDAK